MVKIRIIPSLLLKNKRLVKGVNFKNHLDAGDPLKTCVAHQSQFADEIILIDLDAYEKNISPNYNTIKKIAEQCFTPLTVGGNIDSFEKAIKVIRNGADKILLNSASEDKDLIKKVSTYLGSQCVVIGIDIINTKNQYFIYRRGHKLEIPAEDYILKLVDQDVGEVKITFVNLEGKKRGMDLHFITKISKLINLPTIFEGGLGSLTHIIEAIQAGANSLALGSMLVFSDNNIFKIKQEIKNRQFKTRLRD